MNLRGFTFDDYERLLTAALEADYRIYTLAEYLRTDDPREPHALLRHDVDRKVETALAMAHLEADLGVQSTYYFRRKTFDPSVAAEIEELGHEAGYHYEDYAAADGDLEEAHERFRAALDRFRSTVDVRTVCSHGNAFSPHLNLDMWRQPESPSLDLYDLLGEAYLTLDMCMPDPPFSYFSETGRSWGTDLPDYGRVETTTALLDAFEDRACPRMYLLVHPDRWARTKQEFVERALWDVAAETGKAVAGTVHRVANQS